MANDLDALRLVIRLSTILVCGVIGVGIAAFLRLKKKKSLVYVVFFGVFYVYLFKVLDYTLLQYQSLLLLKHFAPGLILNGQAPGEGVNLIPLVTLTRGHIKTSLLNVLLLIPFGFWLPFIANYSMKKVVAFGALFSVAIELLQLLTGLMARMTFRIADINDVIFNTIGVAVGYMLCAGFVRIYRHVYRKRGMSAYPIFRYVAERPIAPSG